MLAPSPQTSLQPDSTDQAHLPPPHPGGGVERRENGTERGWHPNRRGEGQGGLSKLLRVSSRPGRVLLDLVGHSITSHTLRPPPS